MLPAAVGRTVTALLSHRLGVPSALLSRSEGVWRFEAEAWPDAELKGQAPWQDAVAALETARATTIGDERAAWTGIALGRSTGERTWMLLLPGGPEAWEDTPVVSQFVSDIGALLDDAAEREHGEAWKRTVQRYHRFCRRLTRARHADDLYGLILSGFAGQVRAEVGALALFSEADRQLSIVKTLGYPQQLVDHLRIAPGKASSVPRSALGERRWSGAARTTSLGDCDIAQILTSRFPLPDRRAFSALPSSRTVAMGRLFRPTSLLR